MNDVGPNCHVNRERYARPETGNQQTILIEGSIQFAQTFAQQISHAALWIGDNAIDGAVHQLGRLADHAEGAVLQAGRNIFRRLPDQC